MKPKLPEPGPLLEPLTYEAKGRRDPFAPVELSKDQPGLDVSAFKLVGIISGQQLMALVETTAGLGYILRPGDTLGNGQVTDISADSVTIALSGSGQPARRGTAVTLRLTGR
ncbi:MAG TPA: hypothetical protein VMS64_36840 [Candidatus Methylomirabilis sp.]|nr:hypothetical protein [Candidatus Methylomirabilis sp.]